MSFNADLGIQEHGVHIQWPISSQNVTVCELVISEGIIQGPGGKHLPQMVQIECLMRGVNRVKETSKGGWGSNSGGQSHPRAEEATGEW